MPVLSSTLVLPNMKWLADAEEVEEAAYDCPLTERVEFDLDRHEATVSYTGQEALEQILVRLAEAGYPAANA
ncbi:MAG: heavy-metal-associated domain-containing protein [Fimbriimonadaceae bacterium]